MHRRGLLALILSAIGCGSELPSSPLPHDADPPPPPEGPVVVASAERGEQSETAVAVALTASGPSIVVAFNDFAIDDTFPKGPEYTLPNAGQDILGRRGMSLMGWSISTDGSRSYDYRGKVRPPPGWAAIWGDPSIAVDPGDPSVVFVSDLAISEASWNVGSSGAEELLNPTRFIDGACIARSGDGGLSFPDVACVERPPELKAGCTPGPSLCVDHTSVGVDGKGRLYLAAEVFHAEGQHDAAVHVWRAPSASKWKELALLASQPPAAMDIEPTIVTSPEGDVWIAGATQAFPRDVAVNQQPAGTDDWGVRGFLLSSAGLANYTGGFEERVVTAQDTGFRVGRTFSIAVGSHEGAPDVRVVFSAKRPLDKSFYLGAVHCAPGLGPDGSCVREPAWETEPWPGQQFMPTMSRGAEDPFRFDVAFLTNDSTVGAERTIQMAGISLEWSPEDGATASKTARLTPSGWPVCTRRSASDLLSNYNGYWGDYLGTAQGVGDDGVPFSVTAFSDSRAGTTCTRGDKFADPLHVAAALW